VPAGLTFVVTDNGWQTTRPPAVRNDGGEVSPAIPVALSSGVNRQEATIAGKPLPACPQLAPMPLAFTRPLFVLALTWLLAACSANPPGATALFEATLSDRAGQPLRLAPGEPLIVNFWARWCPPCRDEMPDFQALHRRQSGVRVIGIAIGESPADVRTFASRHGYDYELLTAGADGQALMRALGNDAGALPYTLAIDARGRIVAAKLGRISASELERAAQAVRGDAAPR